MKSCVEKKKIFTNKFVLNSSNNNIVITMLFSFALNNNKFDTHITGFLAILDKS